MKKKFYIIFMLLFIFLTGCTSGCDVNFKGSVTEDIANASDNSSAENSAAASQYELTNDYNSFEDLNLQKDNLQLKINGSLLNFSLPVYIDKNRYYLPLNEIIYDLKGSAVKCEDSLKLNITNKEYSISLTDNKVKCPDKEFTLKENILNAGTDENCIYYISFYDLANMFNMYSRWDKENKIINCRINYDNINSVSKSALSKTCNCSNLAECLSKSVADSEYKLSHTNLNHHFLASARIDKLSSKSKNDKQQIGLIRLEDVCATGQSYHKDYFEDLRIIGNYLYNSNIPFHIAWIPRYKNPAINVDNDPLTTNNFLLAEMVYTLDYLHDKNGTIGLHGYTHQYGNYESGAGFEFGRYEPSPEIFREKIEKAIETAKYLDIPIDFFEVPHYEITPEQNKIAEEYFKILYYPFNDYGTDKADLTKPQLSPYNKSSLYISTPMDYIAEGKEEESLARIKNTDSSYMGSVFFHPALEQSFITLSEDADGSPCYTYAENSTLKRLIEILKDKKYKFISVKELVK